MTHGISPAVDALRGHETERLSREDEEWREEVAEARRRYGAVTARASGLYACPSCALLSARLLPDGSDGSDTSTMHAHPYDRAGDAREARMAEPAGHLGVECPRCGEPLHIRKPHSMSRTWAFLVSAFILYIPANVFPITDTHTLFDDQSDTIFSGVVYLWKAGSWPLALLVFFASIVVPLAKLLVLSGLAVSVQRGVLRKPAQRTRLYRIVEFIGRWSMLDIYAVAILSAMVQLKSLAEVTAGPAVLAFGAVCVLTILASHAFDPRLIWDAIDEADSDPDEDDD